MIFAPFVVKAAGGERVDVEIVPASPEDLRQTQQGWQSNWVASDIMRDTIKKYAMHTTNGELVGLAGYEIWPQLPIVHIIYMESQPESNPTIAGNKRKYLGIGSALVAFGIKLSVDHGFGGEVSFEAKTTELAKHYEKDFGALPLGNYETSGPTRYMLADEAARTIFFRYLERGED